MPYGGWRPAGLNEKDVPESLRNTHKYDNPPNTTGLPPGYWKTANEKEREAFFQKFLKKTSK